MERVPVHGFLVDAVDSTKHRKQQYLVFAAAVAEANEQHLFGPASCKPENEYFVAAVDDEMP